MPLTLPTELLPERVELNGIPLVKKSSFHVSLVCVKEIVLQYEAAGHKDDTEFAQAILERFSRYVTKHPITFLGFRDEFRHVVRGEDESIIVVCDVSNLTQFFDELNTEYGLQIPYQPTHVTLYTLKPNVGIGISSQTNMQSYHTIPMPLLDSVLRE